MAKTVSAGFVELLKRLQLTESRPTLPRRVRLAEGLLRH